MNLLICQDHLNFDCYPHLMETGPHEEAAYATEETGEDVSDVPSAHSPYMEETADDE